jgi:hypothetical protein
MNNLLINFPCVRRKIIELKKENFNLKRKLDEKQEQINKTNAFWKSKFYKK